jgi:hypothetical protein
LQYWAEQLFFYQNFHEWKSTNENKHNPADGTGLHLQFIVEDWHLFVANVEFQNEAQTTDLNKTTIEQKTTVFNNSLAVSWV